MLPPVVKNFKRMKNTNRPKGPDRKKSDKAPASRLKTDPNLHIPKKVAGGATGTMVGALVGGPIGAVVGGVLGTFIGVAAESPGSQVKKAGPEKRAAKSKGESTGTHQVAKGGHSGGAAKKRTARSRS